jgi:general secretion pathway protein J
MNKYDKNKILRPYSFNINTKAAGFTLLELLISITIIAIIVAIVSTAFRLGFRSIDSGENKIDSLERFRTSFRIINSQIQSEIPLKYKEDNKEKYYFKGDRESLQFATNYSIWGGLRGYVIVMYRVEQDNFGKRSLYASENIVGIEAKKEVKLFDKYDEIYFEYFFKDPTEEEGEWADELQEEHDRIPEKIKIHLVDGARKLSIIMPIRVWKPSNQPLQG